MKIKRSHVKMLLEVAARNVETTDNSPQKVSEWLMALVIDLQTAEDWQENTPKDS